MDGAAGADDPAAKLPLLQATAVFTYLGYTTILVFLVLFFSCFSSRLLCFTDRFVFSISCHIHRVIGSRLINALLGCVFDVLSRVFEEVGMSRTASDDCGKTPTKEILHLNELQS